MISTKRELLKGKSGWGRPPSWGCLSMGCSTPLLILGYMGLMPFLGLYTVDVKDFDVIQPFVTAVGLMLMLFGLFFMLAGMKTLYKTIRFRLRRRAHPDEPWLYDYNWNKEGFADTPMSSVLYYVKMCVMFGAFALPWNMFAFHPDMPGLFKIIFGIPILAFDLTIVFCAKKAIYIWLQWYKFGVPYIWFDHFPYRPGETMAVGLGATQQTGPYKEMTLKLRLIEEILSKGGNDRRSSCYQVYLDSQVLKEPEGFILGEENPIPITFELPLDQPGTLISENESRYWEFTAEVPTEGVDFKAEFLIPVYQKKEKSSDS